MPIKTVWLLNESLLNVLWSQKKQSQADMNGYCLLANDRKDISKWGIADIKVFVTFVSRQYRISVILPGHGIMALF